MSRIDYLASELAELSQEQLERVMEKLNEIKSNNEGEN